MQLMLQQQQQQQQQKTGKEIRNENIWRHYIVIRIRCVPMILILTGDAVH